MRNHKGIMEARHAWAFALLTGLAMGLAAGPLGRATPVRAATVLALDLPALVQRADVIATGRVRELQSRRASSGKLIVTDVAFSVLRPLKGDIAVGDSLIITTLGGKLDKLALSVPGEASFQAGETALVFLRRTRHNVLRVVGMAQGRMPIEGHGAGATVQPQHGDLVRVQPGEDATKAGVAPAQPRALSDLLTDIARLVQAGR